jgi:hypothetical protein
MPSLLDLPYEILLDVFSLFPRMKTLRTLCLTHSTIQSLVQPLIFKDIKIRIHFDPFPQAMMSERRLVSLHQALSKNSSLGGYVHYLDVEIDESGKVLGLQSHSTASNSSHAFKQLTEISGWLTNLRELKIRHGLLDQRNPWEWEVTLSMVLQLHNIEVLTLDTKLKLDTHVLLHALQEATKLKTLSVTSSGLLLGNSSKSSPPSADWSMDCLTRLYCDSDAIDMTKILPYCTKLQNLTFPWFDKSIALLPGLLIPFASTLSSLLLICSDRIQSHSQRISLKEFSFIKTLTSLQRLVIVDWLLCNDDEAVDFYEAFLSGPSLKLIWLYTEHTSEHKIHTRPTLVVIGSAFRYGNARWLSVRDFYLDIYLHSTENDLTEIQEEVNVLNNELTGLGVTAECSIQLENPTF